MDKHIRANVQSMEMEGKKERGESFVELKTAHEKKPHTHSSANPTNGNSHKQQPQHPSMTKQFAHTCCLLETLTMCASEVRSTCRICGGGVGEEDEKKNGGEATHDAEQEEEGEEKEEEEEEAEEEEEEADEGKGRGLRCARSHKRVCQSGRIGNVEVRGETSERRGGAGGPAAGEDGDEEEAAAAGLCCCDEVEDEEEADAATEGAEGTERMR